MPGFVASLITTVAKYFVSEIFKQIFKQLIRSDYVITITQLFPTL